MMSFITNLFNRCYYPTKEYSTLPKKDDDLGIEAVQDWIQSYPASEETTLWSIERIHSYVIQLMCDLQKNFPITDSNIEMIKEHLAQLALSSSRLYTFLIKKLEEANIDKWTKKELIMRVALTSIKRI